MNSTNNDATIVTALYDIGREKIDGRKFDQYLEWFKETLKLNCPIIIHCDESTNSFIRENRPSHLLEKTKIVNQRIDQIPYYYLKNKMDAVLNNQEYKEKTKDINRIECKTSLYSIIQYSKFPWIEEAANQNFFHSPYFIWMDAGLSRLTPDINYSQEYPGKNFIHEIKKYPGRMLFQSYQLPYADLFNAKDLSTDYFYDNRSYVMGGMFGGDKLAICKIKKKIEHVLIEEMIGKNRFNNEQIAIGYLLKKNNEDFLILPNDSRIHRNFELVYQTFV